MVYDLRVVFWLTPPVLHMTTGLLTACSLTASSTSSCLATSNRQHYPCNKAGTLQKLQMCSHAGNQESAIGNRGGCGLLRELSTALFSGSSVVPTSTLLYCTITTTSWHHVTPLACVLPCLPRRQSFLITYWVLVVVRCHLHTLTTLYHSILL